jgi:hypothetical protein
VERIENALEFTDARAHGCLIRWNFPRWLTWPDQDGFLRSHHPCQQADLPLSLPSADGGPLENLRRCNKPNAPGILAWLTREGRAESNAASPLELETPGRSLVSRSAVTDNHHRIIASQSQDIRTLADVFGSIYQLSFRQANVLLWLSRGKRNADIASILNISARTAASRFTTPSFSKIFSTGLAASRKVIELLGR